MCFESSRLLRGSSHALLLAGICWDQWFPEAARIMTLMGAELLLYPTAIGTEPEDPTYDSAPHWTAVMAGHAGANMVHSGCHRRASGSCSPLLHRVLPVSVS